MNIMNKLYRRNNNGVPAVWWAELDSGTNSITVFYGLIRGNALLVQYDI